MKTKLSIGFGHALTGRSAQIINQLIAQIKQELLQEPILIRIQIFCDKQRHKYSQSKNAIMIRWHF